MSERDYILNGNYQALDRLYARVRRAEDSLKNIIDMEAVAACDCSFPCDCTSGMIHAAINEAKKGLGIKCSHSTRQKRSSI